MTNLVALAAATTAGLLPAWPESKAAKAPLVATRPQRLRAHAGPPVAWPWHAAQPEHNADGQHQPQPPSSRWNAIRR